MGRTDPHDMVPYYNVDEVIETLPFTSNQREGVEKALMRLAPDAYQAEGVNLYSIWWALSNEHQQAINDALARDCPDIP